jgi:uncharacterized protein
MMDGDNARWSAGTVIVQQDYWREKLVAVRPVTVVEDTAELLALYAPAGASCRVGRWPAASRTELSVEDRLRVYMSDEQAALDERAVRAHVLTLNPPGAQHSFKLFWDREWRLMTWYVNLEAPFLRTHDGIIHRDLFLDIVVTPDLRWAWKDEDELEALCAGGGLTPEECRRVREEGWQMVERIEAGGWPFNSDWPDWRPDPSWSVPALVADWRPHGPPSVC